MSGSATDYLENAILQHTLRMQVMAMPPGCFVALCVTPSSDSTAGTEVVGGGYVRLLGQFRMVVGRNDAAANSFTLEWPAATAPWGAVGWLEVWDAVTAGNRLYWGPMVDPVDLVTPILRLIQTGDILRVPAGGLLITAD
jgi:hypothetical protein